MFFQVYSKQIWIYNPMNCKSLGFARLTVDRLTVIVGQWEPQYFQHLYIMLYLFFHYFDFQLFNSSSCFLYCLLRLPLRIKIVFYQTLQGKSNLLKIFFLMYIRNGYFCKNLNQKWLATTHQIPCRLYWFSMLFSGANFI